MEHKDGIKTTEFWVLMLNIIGMLVNTFVGYLKPETLVIITSILSGVYIIARTVVKMTKTKADDEVLSMIYDKVLSKINVKDE